MNKHAVFILMSLTSVLGLTGCVASTPTHGTVYQRLVDEDPAVRIEAAVEAGNQKDAQAVPLLVDRLSDINSDVRMFSAMALRKITGKDFGWRFYDPREKREEAIRRWREWIRSEREGTASTSPTTQPS